MWLDIPDWVTDYDADGWTRTFGPTPFLIPPADGLWYPILGFGVPISYRDISFMDKTRGRNLVYKPVLHGEFQGVASPKLSLRDVSVVDGFWSVLDKGDFSPRDRRYAVVDGQSVFPYGSVDSIWSEPVFHQSDTRLVDLDQPLTDWEEDPWWRADSGAPTFVEATTSTNEVLAYNTLRKVTVHEWHRIRHWNGSPNEQEPWLLPLPHFMQGYRHSTKVTITEIMCDQGGVKIRAHVKSSSWFRSIGPWWDTNETRPYEDDVEWALHSARTDWPGVPPEPRAKAACRVLCSRLESNDALEPFRVERRTRALMEIEDLGTNNLENISGLAEAGSIIKVLLEGYKAIKSGNPILAIKALASAYLAYKFSVESTFKDAISIKKLGPKRLAKIKEKRPITRRKSLGPATVEDPCFAVSSVRLCAEFVLLRNTDPESVIFDALDSLGLLTSPANLWDLVPLSFVLDWFVGVGDALDALLRIEGPLSEGDARHYTLEKRIESSKFLFVCSTKFVEQVFGKGWFTPVPISGKLYRRSLYDDWGYMTPLSVIGGSGFGFQQRIYAGALITNFLKTK